jgi:type II secretory pathway component PulF
LKKIAIQRFALTLSSLFASGLPILDSLAITADAVGDVELRDAILRISNDGIAKGLTIGDAFKREPAFPKVVTNLISISEKSGNLASILGTLAEFYESEIKSSVKVLVSFLEPMLLLTIGVVVGTIALAIIVPVYQLMGKF